MTKITSVRLIDFNDEMTIAKEIDDFVQQYAYAEVEYALELSPTGKAYSLTGTKINVNSEIIGKDVLKGSISIHNHPVEIGKSKSDSFSLDDLLFATRNSTGKQYLVSGERKNAFEFTKIHDEITIYNSWKGAYMELLEQAITGKIDIINEQEQILQILDKRLEGFKFYENF